MTTLPSSTTVVRIRYCSTGIASPPRQHVHAHLTDNGGRRQRLTNYSRRAVYAPLHLTLRIPPLQYAPRGEERQG